MSDTEFAKQVRLWAQQRNAVLFPNGQKEEILPVVTALFDQTKEEILIYDECLGRGDPAFDQAFYESAQTLLQNDRQLKIALRHDRVTPGPIYKQFSQLKTRYRRQLDVRLASPDFRDGFATWLHNDKNFILSDAHAYRIESDASPQDAVACFHNPALAALLAVRFKKTFRFCPRYF